MKESALYGAAPTHISSALVSSEVPIQQRNRASDVMSLSKHGAKLHKIIEKRGAEWIKIAKCVEILCQSERKRYDVRNFIDTCVGHFIEAVTVVTVEITTSYKEIIYSGG